MARVLIIELCDKIHVSLSDILQIYIFANVLY